MKPVLVWRDSKRMYVTGETCFCGPWPIAEISYDGTRPKGSSDHWLPICTLPRVVKMRHATSASQAKEWVEAEIQRWFDGLQFIDKEAK